jgi:hypothetical protein
MSIASAFLDPTFYDGLTNVHILIPPSSIPVQSLFAATPTDSSRVVIDKVNRLVHIFLNVFGTLSETSVAQNGLLWQYRAFQNPIGNELPSIRPGYSTVIQSRVIISQGATVIPADINLTNAGGNINIVANNTISGLLATGTSVVSGTIIYPY